MPHLVQPFDETVDDRRDLELLVEVSDLIDNLPIALLDGVFAMHIDRLLADEFHKNLVKLACLMVFLQEAGPLVCDLKDVGIDHFPSASRLHFSIFDDMRFDASLKLLNFVA
jgi:hypothetical protein